MIHLCNDLNIFIFKDDTIEKATEAENPLPENIPTEATVDEEPQPQPEDENEEFQGNYFIQVESMN